MAIAGVARGALLSSSLPAALLVTLLLGATLGARSDGKAIPEEDSVLSDTPCFVVFCHDNIGSSFNQEGSLALEDLPGEFVPGQTYSLTVQIGGGEVYGIQIAVVYSDNTQAGVLTSDTAGVVADAVQGVGILVHSPSPLLSGTVRFRWTAPLETGEDAVTFRLASNSANGNFSPTGDDINTLQIELPRQTLTQDEKLHFAQFGNGTLDEVGLKSDIVVSNPSATETASATIGFHRADGSAFNTEVESIGTTDSVSISIPPLDSTTVSTTGQGELATGTVVVSSDLPLGGGIRFDITAPPGTGSGIAGVPASQVLAGFVTPVRRVAGGINTGVAVRNVEPTQVQIFLSLRDEDGVEVPGGSASRTIPGNGQLVDFIDGLFPDADTAGLVGSLVAASDGMIAATAIEQGIQPGQFTTLPVTPLE